MLQSRRPLFPLPRPSFRACLDAVMLTLEQLPAPRLRGNTDDTNVYGSCLSKDIWLSCSQRRRIPNPPPTLCKTPPWTWDCREGDVTMATTTTGQVATPIEPGGQLFNSEGEKRWLTDSANKREVKCEGMWPPLFNKHLRNAHRTFSSSPLWSFTGAFPHIGSLLVYFRPIATSFAVCRVLSQQYSSMSSMRLLTQLDTFFETIKRMHKFMLLGEVPEGHFTNE